VEDDMAEQHPDVHEQAGISKGGAYGVLVLVAVVAALMIWAIISIAQSFQPEAETYYDDSTAFSDEAFSDEAFSDSEAFTDAPVGDEAAAGDEAVVESPGADEAFTD
jgi:hypothetical protein